MGGVACEPPCSLTKANRMVAFKCVVEPRSSRIRQAIPPVRSAEFIDHGTGGGQQKLRAQTDKFEERRGPPGPTAVATLRIETRTLTPSPTVPAYLKGLGRQSMKCTRFTLGTILVVLFTRFASPTVSAGSQGQGHALWRAVARSLASAGQSLRAAAAGVCALLLLGVSVPAYGQSVFLAGAQTTAPTSGLNEPYGVAWSNFTQARLRESAINVAENPKN